MVIALSVPSLLWVTHVAPHWIAELEANLARASAPGGNSDMMAGFVTSFGFSPFTVIDLQAVVSLFWENPNIYNFVSYLVCGVLLAVWSVKTVRTNISPKSAWLALAAISALTMLPTYHRPYDAKLLMLSFPACAMLWAEGGPIGWLAVLLTTACVALTGDIPLILLTVLTRNLHVDTASLPAKILAVAVVRPIPLLLLAMAVFYLWVYARAYARPLDLKSKIPA